MAQTPRAFPVSPGQARLWYLQQLYPGSSTNNLNVLLTRRGPLDPDPLRAALAALVERHEPLRTTFREGPEQLVLPAPDAVPLASSDLSGLPAGARDAALRALQAEDARGPFDLTRWPLFRFRLVRLAPDEHGLIMVHHVISDAASMQVLAGDLAELYLARVEGRPPELPELRIQYVDYVAWQAGQPAAAAEALDWWRSTLAGVPPLPLVPGRPRPVALGGGAEREDAWEPAFGRQVAELGAAARATPFMTVLAGWAALLARCTGADDLALGVPMSDRPSGELDRVVGYFIDMVAVRVDLGGDPTFRDLLGRVRTAVIEAFERRTVPFEQVVDAVRPERAPAETPLFQAGLNVVPLPPPAASERHQAFWSDGQEYGDGSTKYDLFLTLYEQAGGAYGVVVDWRVGLLPDEVAGALPGRLRTLLAAAGSAPDTVLSRLPLAGPEPASPVGDAQVPDGVVLRPWDAPAPGDGPSGRADAVLRAGASAGPGSGPDARSEAGSAAAVTVLAGEGWSAGLARSWAATGTRLFRTWAPPGWDRPVLGGPWTDAPGASRAPLGRPLAGRRIRVLGPDGGAVPPGLPGQLHVATGDGPERPTGTVVRALPDGQLEYAGPLGGRVRVGGYPVEPATVEAALLEEPEVAAATVLLRGDRLVAYVRPLPGTGPAGAALRSRLVARLSPAQVPAAVVVLADPPLRTDGTLDLRMLPAGADQPDTIEHVPPRTPTERRLAAIWADVLERDGIGVTDNFFALGGDSFRCLRVVTAAAAAGLPITPVDVFARQTIAGLADVLPADAGAPPAVPAPAGVLRRLAARPLLVAELDRPVGPDELAGWPVRVEPGPPTRLVGDGALLDDRSWTELLAALATGATVPAAPAPVPDAGPADVAAVGPGLVAGEWAVARVAAPLPETSVRAAVGGAAVDLVLAALAAALPGPEQVVELSDVDGLLGSADRPAGRLARDVRLTVATGPGGRSVEAVRDVKEAVRGAARGGGTDDAPAVGVSVLPALPPGVRDVDEGPGALVAPLEVRVRPAGGRAELVFRGLSGTWPAAPLAALAERTAAALAEIGAAVSGVGSRVYSPSDFPEAGLSQDQLDQLLDRLGRG